MFFYRFPFALVTASLLIQPTVVIAQDLTEINNIARNISVKITGYGNGSGFILDKQDNVYSVVTNKHVVPIDREYQIQTYDGIKHLVTERQEIPDLDLAIIRFESTEEYQVAELGNSDELNLQQTISVAGFPGEQTDLDLVRGDIRSIKQDIIDNPASKQGYALIYTNQTLPGSSGGAVIDAKGRVVGINGEGETDIQTGREISRGIPINIFLDAEEKLLAAENNPPTSTTDNIDNSTADNTSSESNISKHYQLAITIPNNAPGLMRVAVTGDNIIGNSLTTIKVWNLKTGELISTLKDDSNSIITSIAVGGEKIIYDSGNTIRVWNLTTGKLENTLQGHSASITTVAVGKDKIISGSRDNTVRVWNLATGKLERILTGHSNPVNSVAIHEDKIVSIDTVNTFKTIKVWNLTTGKLENTITDHTHSNNFFHSVAISRDSILSESENRTIKVWNLLTGELEHTLSGHFDEINSVAVSEDKIISGSRDNTIKVWSLTTGELENTLQGHSASITSVAVSEDKIISGSRDNTIKVWNLQK